MLLRPQAQPLTPQGRGSRALRHWRMSSHKSKGTWLTCPFPLTTDFHLPVFRFFFFFAAFG